MLSFSYKKINRNAFFCIEMHFYALKRTNTKPINEKAMSFLLAFALRLYFDFILLWRKSARRTSALKKERQNARINYVFKIFGDFFHLDGAAR